MRILLFGGFLGSGKTTTILQVAKHITTNFRQTVAIIENEIGEAGIDDKLLETTGLNVKPLFGGCVCCQITGDLILAIKEIKDTLNPDWLIIEMTGLAVPENITNLINKYVDYYNTFKTITITDLGRWLELKEILGPLVTSQVKKTDLVVINKADVADAEMDKTQKDQIINDIQAISDNTPILVVSAAGQLPLNVLEAIIG